MTLAEFKELPQNLLKLKIKSIMFSLGMHEKYIAFEYLSFILTKLIIEDDDSLYNYKETLNIMSTKYNITNKTIMQNLNKILKTCSNLEIKNKMQFNIGSNSILNKIRVLKHYSQQCLLNS